MRKAAFSFCLSLLILNIVFVAFFAFDLAKFVSTMPASHAAVIHEGNLTIADNEVFLIADCEFHQNGSVVVQDNATLVIRNSQYYQVNNNYEFIFVKDVAKLFIENSSVFFSQAFDVKISLLNHTTMNITDSSIENSASGIWIWMEENATLTMRSCNLTATGDGARVITDHNCRAEVQSSVLDYVVCWGNSSTEISESVVNKGVKAWSTSHVKVSNCFVDYFWAYSDCRLEVRNTTIPSNAPFETALRAIGNADVSIFFSLLHDNVNAATNAKVRLRDSSVRNVSAYDNSIVWLVNTTAETTHAEGQAKIFNFSSIQDAVNKANENDTVLIPSGIYRENIVVNKTLSINGETKENTFLTSNGTEAAVSILANSVLFSGFTIKDSECGISVSSARGCTLTNNTITNNTQGVIVNASEKCTISFNRIENNTCGLTLSTANNCTVVWNVFHNNEWATKINASSQNLLHHNNFLENLNEIYTSNSSNNSFDDGIEGNFWSSYFGADLNHDGIGDAARSIDENSKDDYPLMGIASCFVALNYTTVVISNSTIEKFGYFISNNTIKLHVSNSTQNQSHGFCRIVIPRGLINATDLLVIIDDGLTQPLFFNNSIMENETHRWIYFAYEHSSRVIDIVPESITYNALLILILPFIIFLLKKTQQKSHTLSRFRKSAQTSVSILR
ncbi:MAG: NosD domain-containing protein [Candidatus Bathyarchaeia archaeon]